LAERIRITGKNDGVNDNEAIDVQVDSTFSAAHVKSHLYGFDGVAGFTNPIVADSNGYITINQGGTWNIGDITGTISLPTGAATSANQTDGSQKTAVINTLVTVPFDEVALGYTGDNMTTAVYKLASTTVATLTLSYSGSILTGVVKS